MSRLDLAQPSVGSHTPGRPRSRDRNAFWIHPAGGTPSAAATRCSNRKRATSVIASRGCRCPACRRPTRPTRPALLPFPGAHRRVRGRRPPYARKCRRSHSRRSRRSAGDRIGDRGRPIGEAPAVAGDRFGKSDRPDRQRGVIAFDGNRARATLARRVSRQHHSDHSGFRAARGPAEGHVRRASVPAQGRTRRAHGDDRWHAKGGATGPPSEGRT